MNLNGAKPSVNDRYYDRYASTHAGLGDGTSTSMVYRRDIRPRLLAHPTPLLSGMRILDIGCGQGELVRLLLADGFDAHGVDISTDQVEVARAAGLRRVVLGDFRVLLDEAQSSWDAVVATDVLEHLGKEDVVRTFDHVRRGLRPGGVFVARVPNAVSPTGGHIRYGDFTHETSFTWRSLTQIATVAGFASVQAYSCPPVAHGVKSAARMLCWKPISGLFKLALAAETGRLRGHIVTQNLTFVARRELGDGP